MGGDNHLEKNFEADKFAMNKYSRQVGEYGVAAMETIIKMKILIIGLKGVGIEAAKNLILAGVGSVTLFDDDIVKVSDLGTNFYLRESDIGKTSCARGSLKSLKSLNPLVNVNIHEGRLTNKHISKFTVVLDCGLTIDQAKICNRECRKAKTEDKKPVKFIRANVHGLVGYTFVDFGSEFTVIDKTGEQPVQRIIETIDTEMYEASEEIVIHLVPPPEGKRHNIQDDDHEGWIKFDEIDGELGAILNNTEKPFRVKMNDRTLSNGKQVFDPYSLRITLKLPKVKTLPPYTGGGVIIQTKQPVVMKFNTLEKNLLNPVHPEEGSLLFTDGTKFGRPEQLHIALNGLWIYESQNKSLPPANDEKAMNEVLKLATDYNETMKKDKTCLSVEAVDEDVVRSLARFAECKFQPLCCFFGGVVAQEIVKYTGKYTPLHQWVHIDCFEVLPEKFVDANNPNVFTVSNSDRKPIGSRYDDLIQIIGLPLHRKLSKVKTFMVGCGALGCEMLKNFAMIGLACDESKAGLITVTDNDSIEISNLSRQFLFREDNVGQPKALAAGASVKVMNDSINVAPLLHLVAPASENIFNAEFWESLDFVTNALDNVTARVYVDNQCVFYEKALLESGTLGTKCNSQIIVPHMTQSYADGPNDEVGDNIPMCTLRNFPSQIEHCIEWARARFTDIFEIDSTKASNYLKDPSGYVKELKSKTLDLDTKAQILSAVANEMESLSNIYKAIMFAKSPEASFDTCVKMAYDSFHQLFRDKIVSLIKSHPENDKDEKGNLFWSGTKRFPQVGIFDVNNESHLSFVMSMANILALSYGVFRSQKDFIFDASRVKNIASGFVPPETKLEEIDLSEEDNPSGKKKEMGSITDDMVIKFEGLLKDLEELATSSSKELKGVKIEPPSFEKDDDANCHIDFITAASNIRAWNYRLKQVSRHKCKMIAGKIIPALATTTAAITGLITIELLKLIQPGKKLEAFKDSSNSLGINGYFFSEPNKPVEAKDEFDVINLAEVTCLPPKFTKWNKTVVKGADLSLKQFLTKFNKHYIDKYGKDVRITMLLHTNSNLPSKKGYSKFIYEKEKGDDDKAEKMERSLKESIVETYGEEVLARTYVRLDVACEDEEGNAYKVPEVVYHFA